MRNSTSTLLFFFGLYSATLYCMEPRRSVVDSWLKDNSYTVVVEAVHTLLYIHLLKQIFLTNHLDSFHSTIFPCTNLSSKHLLYTNYGCGTHATFFSLSFLILLSLSPSSVLLCGSAFLAAPPPLPSSPSPTETPPRRRRRPTRRPAPGSRGPHAWGYLVTRHVRVSRKPYVATFDEEGTKP